jgi:V/A-type H+/Na+-transporting ATPase subunit E
MVRDSLKKVIEKLKKEGIDAAEVEALKIKQKAEADAEDIAINAEMKANSILKAAEVEIKKAKEQHKLEMERASKIGLAAFKSSVEKALIVPTLDDSLSKVLATPVFLEKVILEMVKGFGSNNFKGADLDIILPEDLKKQLGTALAAKMKMLTAGGTVTVQFDENISYGFKIGPSGKGFVFDLTDDGFNEIFTRFISPKFREYFVS